MVLMTVLMEVMKPIVVSIMLNKNILSIKMCEANKKQPYVSMCNQNFNIS